jgi:ABC-type polysaccharide/polyol phosphate export permease
VVLPIETISPTLREIASFNPFVLSEKVIRELFIFHSSLSDIGVDLLLLLGYAVILFLIVLFIELVMHRHLLERIRKRSPATTQKNERGKA